jgi:hypothetical protein
MDSPRLARKSSRAPARAGAVFACVLAALAAASGCGDEPPLVSVTFRLTGAPAPADGRCPVEPSPVAPDLTRGAPDTLRLTFRTPGAGLVCDVLLPLDQPAPILAVPGQGPVDIHAELFAGEALVGRGRALGTAIAEAGVVDLPIAATDAFECGAGALRRGRAFHTATLLPDGRVLIVGGVDDAAAIVPAVGLMPTDAVSVYDPVTGTERPVSVPGLTPRLGHEAIVVQSDPAEVRVALVGGIAVAGDPSTTPALVAAMAGDALRWMPTGGAVGAPVEILIYDLADGSARTAPPGAGTPVPPRLLAAAALAGNPGQPRPVLAGGWAAGVPASDFHVIAPQTGASAGAAPLGTARLAATLTDLGDGRALLWGGQLLAAEAERAALAGELLAGLAEGATPSSQPLVLSPDGAVPAARLAHTAVATGPGAVLVAGGFTIAADARTPEPVFAQLVTVAGATTSVATVTGDPTTPAGFPASIALPGGGALITGGNPAVGHGTCPLTDAGLLCALAEAHRLVPAPLGLARAPDLTVARYGHRLTRLDDGSVLVTGGLHPIGETLVALADVERYDPAGAAVDPLADLAPLVTRAPADLARGPDGDPVGPCAIIETDVPAQ